MKRIKNLSVVLDRVALLIFTFKVHLPRKRGIKAGAIWTGIGFSLIA